MTALDTVIGFPHVMSDQPRMDNPASSFENMSPPIKDQNNDVCSDSLTSDTGSMSPANLSKVLNLLNQQGRVSNIQELVELLQQIQTPSRKDDAKKDELRKDDRNFIQAQPSSSSICRSIIKSENSSPTSTSSSTPYATDSEIPPSVDQIYIDNDRSSQQRTSDPNELINTRRLSFIPTPTPHSPPSTPTVFSSQSSEPSADHTNIVDTFSNLSPVQQDAILRRLNGNQLLDVLRRVSKPKPTLYHSNAATESVRRLLVEKAFGRLSQQPNSYDNNIYHPLNSPNSPDLLSALIELKQSNSPSVHQTVHQTNNDHLKSALLSILDRPIDNGSRSSADNLNSSHINSSHINSSRINNVDSSLCNSNPCDNLRHVKSENSYFQMNPMNEQNDSRQSDKEESSLGRGSIRSSLGHDIQSQLISAALNKTHNNNNLVLLSLLLPHLSRAPSDISTLLDTLNNQSNNNQSQFVNRPSQNWTQSFDQPKSLSTQFVSAQHNPNAGDTVLNLLSSLLLGDQCQQAAPAPLSEPHVALAASLADMSVNLSQAGGTKTSLDMAELTRSLREDGRYMFDAQMRTHLLAGSKNGKIDRRNNPGGSCLRRGTTEYSCSYPGVSWNTRMQSWLVYFEDTKGRKSRTFNPKRLSINQLELLPTEIRLRYETEPVEVAMHCACVYAARVRWESRVRKSLGFQGSRSQSRSVRDVLPNIQCNQQHLLSSFNTAVVPKSEPSSSSSPQSRPPSSQSIYNENSPDLRGPVNNIDNNSLSGYQQPVRPQVFSTRRLKEEDSSLMRQRQIESVIKRAANEIGYPSEERMLTPPFLPLQQQQPLSLQSLIVFLSRQHGSAETPLMSSSYKQQRPTTTESDKIVSSPSSFDNSPAESSAIRAADQTTIDQIIVAGLQEPLQQRSKRLRSNSSTDPTSSQDDNTDVTTRLRRKRQYNSGSWCEIENERSSESSDENDSNRDDPDYPPPNFRRPSSSSRRRQQSSRISETLTPDSLDPSDRMPKRSGWIDKDESGHEEELRSLLSGAMSQIETPK